MHVNSQERQPQQVQVNSQIKDMLLSLLLLFVLASPALSLKCYVCSSSTTNEECNNNTQECQAPVDMCMTVVDTLGSAKSIVKQCASQDTCNSASSSVDANGDGNTINCCNTHDLCNFSGAKSVHVRTSVLLSAAGALLLLSH
ncbi:lymphocyte antigen 6D [Takifugu rubripes]|uniref:Lymphocyte antigen 6D n=1 Tax=Takifugu rubripes TaxID=31033 RepID=A0A674PB66_TAKRU|nr:lymphocyte antigen 6D [Takifugu rubripes]